MTKYKASQEDWRGFAKRSHGVFEVMVVRPAAMLVAMLFDRDRPDFGCLMTSVAHWLRTIPTKSKGSGPLCLVCDYEFHRDSEMPMAFVVIMGAGHREMGMMSGICANCAMKHDDAALQRILCKQWEAHPVATGQA